MKSTLTALYYGNPPPYERKPAEIPDAERLYGEVKRQRDALAATLSDGQKALLEAYDNAMDAYAEETHRERFAEGFRAGLRLGAECFSEP